LVSESLHNAKSHVNIAFDLWTSPGRYLSLLGVVAYYLDTDWKLRIVLLTLPRMFSRYTGISIAKQISELITFF
jgi:hypothetical protein